MNLHRPQKLTSSFCNSKQDQYTGCGHGGIDACLDILEDGDDDSGQENDHLDWAYHPELVHCLRRGDQITHGMDDDSGEGCLRNIKEYSSESIDCKQDKHSGDDPGKGSTNSSFRFNRSPRK